MDSKIAEDILVKNYNEKYQTDCFCRIIPNGMMTFYSLADKNNVCQIGVNTLFYPNGGNIFVLGTNKFGVTFGNMMSVAEYFNGHKKLIVLFVKSGKIKSYGDLYHANECYVEDIIDIRVWFNLLNDNSKEELMKINPRFVILHQNPTTEMYLDALRRDPMIITRIKNQTDEMGKIITERDPTLFIHIKNPNLDTILNYVRYAAPHNVNVLNDIKNPNLLIIATAVICNPRIIDRVKTQKIKDIQDMVTVLNDPNNVSLIQNPCQEIVDYLTKRG